MYVCLYVCMHACMYTDMDRVLNIDREYGARSSSHWYYAREPKTP